MDPTTARRWEGGEGSTDEDIKAYLNRDHVVLLEVVVPC